MLVKVKKGQDSWLMFSDVSSLEYDDKPRVISTPTEVNQLFSPTVVTRHTVISKSSYPVSVKLMKFKVGADSIEVVFDSIAFLCNDQGRTVERVYGYDRD